MTVAMVTATRVMTGNRVAATKTEPTFRRGWHLLFAIIGLAHGPVTTATGAAVLWLTGARAWSAELVALEALAQLGFAAIVAWLAFSLFDTHAGVTVLPKRWRDIGGMLAAWAVFLECCSAWIVWRDPAAHWNRVSGWLELFNGLGELQVVWLAICMLAFPIGEEIVYRGLLLRALEGYMGQNLALVIQAAVFELVHAYVYGYGLTGVWFIIGYFLGAAFQRTRSLAVPMLLHAAHNTLYFVLVWYFNQ